MAKKKTEKATTVEVFERALKKALATPPEAPRKKAKKKRGR
jgi:hypothetical protein